MFSKVNFKKLINDGKNINPTVNYEEFKDLLPLFELENPYEKYIDMKLKTNS